jgi:hypothetical protein
LQVGKRFAHFEAIRCGIDAVDQQNGRPAARFVEGNLVTTPSDVSDRDTQKGKWSVHFRFFQSIHLD